MNTRTLFTLAALVVAAGLTMWLQEQIAPPDELAKLGSEGHRVDYFLEGFTMTAMGEDGKPRHRLQSVKMLHYADDESTVLAEPRMTFYREKGSPWQISAQRGWVSADGELVLLREDVVIERPASAENELIRLTTSELRIHPEIEFAETDKPVLLVTDTSRTEAVGMRAYVQQGQLQLLDRVRGRYE